MSDKLFETIAADLGRQISTGALLPGARVTSVRRVATQYEVSTNTVLHAFATLEARGLVEARPQSGYFVRHRATHQLEVPQPPPSRRPIVPRPIGDRLPGFFRAMRDPAMVAFGAACPSPELLPSAKLARVLGQVARLLGPKGLQYDPLPGYAPLRREVARRLVASGCSVNSEDVLTTVGAIEALHVALKTVTRQGDAVLVESPCYFGVLQLLTELGLRAVELPADPCGGLSIDVVDAALRRERPSACVVVPSFSNPLGSLMPVRARRALVALCARADVALIESDVYGELAFEGVRPAPLKAFDRTGHVLHCSSFSKTMAPGLRVGWLVPGRYAERAAQLKFTHTVATPTVTQAAVAEFLVSGGYDRHLRALRRALREQLSRGREAIAANFPVGTRVSNPLGGFLLWVQLPGGCVDAITLQRRALASGISIAPGSLFSARGEFEDFFRLSCGQPWSPAIEDAIARLGSLARKRG